MDHVVQQSGWDAGTDGVKTLKRTHFIDRIARRAFPVSVCVSILVLAATTIVWVRSYRVSDGGAAIFGSRLIHVRSVAGMLVVETLRPVNPQLAWRFRW